MKITVGIKALNEERHIAEAIASALAAVEPLGGEVILADCGSTDRTIELARAYPIRIFQLEDRSQRSCGAGAQLAFQGARGDYFYILDGDMVLNSRFLVEGVAYLETHADVAAVGGLVTEMNTQSEEYQIREQTNRADRNWQPGQVDRLDCGGLYRTEVIRRLGYFADRNLHAFEELELAARLQSQGWKLARINTPAVRHYGHAVSGFHLLGRWLRSGYASAAGEVLRSAIGRPQLLIVLRSLQHIRYGAAVIVWWLLLLVLLFQYPLAFLFGLCAPLVFLIVRRGSFSLGVYSYAMWNVMACGLILGLGRVRAPPREGLTARVLAVGPSHVEELSLAFKE